MVSPGARLVRVERVGRVEGGSSEPVATRPLVWNFSTLQPFNLFTSYYTHDNSPRVEGVQESSAGFCVKGNMAMSDKIHMRKIFDRLYEKCKNKWSK